MWNLVSFVGRSKMRAELLKLLGSPKTPTQLGKILKIHRSSVSRALIELEDKKLVECLTPNEAVYRLYKITSKGKQILSRVEKL